MDGIREFNWTCLIVSRLAVSLRKTSTQLTLSECYYLVFYILKVYKGRSFLYAVRAIIIFNIFSVYPAKVILAVAEEQLVSSDFLYILKYILLYAVTDYYNASFAQIF
jgi:hypothetical protein